MKRTKENTGRRRPGGSLAAFLVFCTVIFGSLGVGCGNQPVGRSTASADGGVVGPAASVLAESPKCSASVSESQNRLQFSTSLACATAMGEGEPACALGPLALQASATVSSGAGTATTEWKILQGGEVLATKVVRSVAGVTATDIGIASQLGVEASLHDEAGIVSGSVAGRALVPTKHAQLTPGFHFVDGKPGPQVSINLRQQEALRLLLDKASADARSLCPAADGLGAAVANLQASLKYGEAKWVSDRAAVDQGTASTHIVVDSVTLASGDAPAVEGVPTVSIASDQNNLGDFVTPECKSCEQNCVFNQTITTVCGFLTALFPPAGVVCGVVTVTVVDTACSATCFIPGNGCNKNSCATFPQVGTCDDNESCCGSICCGAGSVCGTSSLGECCPADNPVGCGDVTLVTCFAAGSTCCGNLPQACPPGQVCTNVTATGADCCPANQLASDGTCCQRPACGGSCCDQGTCSNGTCCAGPVDSSGACCAGGLSAVLCSGQCCVGACTTGGSCCPSGSTVCGAACCASGQTCLDASSSTCGVPTQPTLTLLDPTTGDVLAQSGLGEVVPVSNQQTILVRGQGYSPGTVTLSVDTPGGTVITTVTADSTGSFSTTITTGQFTSGSHQIVGSETVGGSVVQASVALNVTVLT